MATHNVSLTDLANDALGQIGSQFITSIDDETATSNLVLRYLYQVLDDLIRRHRWNFALVRTTLSQEATAPAAKWTYAYALPADCLRVIELGDDYGDSPWQIERVNDKKCIVSDEETMSILYLARVDDPNKWDASFYQAAAAHLASKLASGMLRDSKRALELFQLAEARTREAVTLDGQEGFVDEIQATDLTDDVRS